MKSNLTRLSLVSTMLLGAACTTVPKDAPQEFHDAQAAIDKAEDKDVDNTLPKTMQRAEDKLDSAVAMYKDAGEKSATGEPLDAAIKTAVEAKVEAEEALNLHNDVKGWDDNINNYTAMRRNANDAVALRNQLDSRETVATTNTTPNFAMSTPLAFFATSEHELGETNTTNDNNLQSLVDLLKEQPDMTVELVGFADHRGSAAFNEQLSKQRAEEVAAFLEGQGVDSSRIKIEYKGSTAAADVQDAGRLQLDRRVDARVISVAH